MEQSEINIILDNIRELENLCYGIDNFKFREYKGKKVQEKIISAMIAGRDVLTVLSTGGGKTLCFQAPAIVTEGITIVVSPLAALCMDQVQQFNEHYCDQFSTNPEINDDPKKAEMLYKKYNATAIGRGLEGKLPRAAYPGMFDLYGANFFYELKNGKRAANEVGQDVVYKILYLSPERLMNEKFRAALMNAIERDALRISRIVYDEAHCFSQWGFSFRPEYLNTLIWITSYETLIRRIKGREIKSGIPEHTVKNSHLPRAGFTATASLADVNRIEQLLEFKRPKEFIYRGINPQLSIEIKNLESEKTDFGTVIKGLLCEEDFNKCIVFCTTKKKASYVERQINDWLEPGKTILDNGMRQHVCNKYYASMHIWDKTAIDESFQKKNTEDGYTDILAASIAYGLGIDNKMVDFVINYGMAKSLEEYIQMAGRAGRGSSAGKAVLVYKRYSSTDAASMMVMASKIIKWELEPDVSPAIKRLSDEYKNLLILMKIFRFCQYKNIIEKCCANPDEDFAALVEQYFEYDVSDKKNGEDIKNSVNLFLEEIEEKYNAELEGYTIKIENLLKEETGQGLDKDEVKKQKRKLKSISKKISKITEILNNVKIARNQTNETIKIFYGDMDQETPLQSLENLYEETKRNIEEQHVIKINNTQVANILRKGKVGAEKIEYGKSYTFLETERYIKKLNRWYSNEYNNYLLENRNISHSTGIVYIPTLSLDEMDDETILKIVNDTWNIVNVPKYLYLVEYAPNKIRYKSYKSVEKYRSYFVRHILEKKENNWVFSVKGEKREITYKGNVVGYELVSIPVDENSLSDDALLMHIGADVNKLRDSNKSFFATAFETLEKAPVVFLVDGVRSRNIEFMLDVDDDEENITFWDMCIADVIYSLYSEGKRRIYLQAIWGRLCGNLSAELSGGWRDENGIKRGIKEEIKSSIEKLSRIRLQIRDSRIYNQEISGYILPVKPYRLNDKSNNEAKKEFGYVIEEMPFLAKYGNELNGQFITRDIALFDIKKCFSNEKYCPPDSFYDAVKSEKTKGIEVFWGYSERKALTGEKGNAVDNIIQYSRNNICLMFFLVQKAAIASKTKIFKYVNYQNIIETLEMELGSNHDSVFILDVAFRVFSVALDGYIDRKKAMVLLY